MKEKITAWVARDEDGKLLGFKDKTVVTKGYESWLSVENAINYPDNLLFVLHHDFCPQIKWEDKEPTEVEFIIKTYE